jgi:hypothetical protein
MVVVVVVVVVASEFGFGRPIIRCIGRRHDWAHTISRQMTGISVNCIISILSAYLVFCHHPGLHTPVLLKSARMPKGGLLTKQNPLGFPPRVQRKVINDKIYQTT